jgi:MscS family membrane protein
VGLRSTRIRTLDRTILSVPNGQIATANIETISDRDKFWFRHVIGVKYGTTPDQMRQIVSRVRDLLHGRTGVEIDSVRARFFRVAPSSLDIEIVSYIFAADWPAFLEIQEELLLRIMEIVDEVGTEIAFPSQTVHLADDREPSRVPESLVAEPDLRVRT